MQMTRELKKRFGAIDDRLEKIEKRKPVQRTNGEAYEDPIPQIDAHHERLDSIEAALIIPGPEGHISGWRDQVQKILTKLEDRILQVELRGAWTPDEAKTLDGRVKNLWERPSIETLKVFLKATEDRVSKLEQIPEPSSEITMRGRPLAEWVSDMENRVGTLERKPMAGPLSNIAQGMEQEIKNLKNLGREHELELYGPEGEDTGNGLKNQIMVITQSVKTLRRKVQRVTWLSLLLFAMIILTLYLV